MDRSKPVILDHIMLKQKDKLLLKRVQGRTPKAFAKLYDKPRGLRVGKSKGVNSLFFKEMFKGLLSGQSTYTTYMNDHFTGKNKGDVVLPDYVRCIIKEMVSPNLPYYNEVVGSRLANLLKVDTVYNMAYQIDPNDDIAPDDYDYLLSVDYLPDGYTDYSMSNIGIDFDIDDSLEDIMTNVYRGLRRLNRTGKIGNDIDQFEQFGESFAKQYLFRSLICEDSDYCSRNVGFMVNKNGDYKLCPCFDMELLFQGKRCTDYYKESAERDLLYLHKTMPDIVEDFLNRCNWALQRGEIDNVMTNSIKVEDRFSSRALVKNNISKLTAIYNKIKNSPEMEN